MDGGKYTQTFTSAIYSASQALTSEQFEKAISNILKLGDLDVQAIMKGESGQLDILQELGKGKIDFSDIIMTSDGIHDHLSHLPSDEFTALFTSKDEPKVVLERFVEAALEGESKDDLSVIMIEM